VRNFGFKKFIPFIKSLGAFEFKEERVPGSNNKLTYIREKQEKQEKPAAPEKPATPEKLSAPAAAVPAEAEKTPEKSGLPVAAPQTALVEKKDPVPGRRNWRRKNFGGRHED
jgi:hypothetical protein